MRGLSKKWVNRVLRAIGFQLVAKADDERAALVEFLHANGIGHVFDIGANSGQFATQLLDKGYAGRIHCVEPLSSAHHALSSAFARHSRVKVLPRAAAGADFGTATLNIAANSVSSSLMEMESIHVEAAPRSAFTGTETVSLTTVDALFGSQKQLLAEGAMLKIDAQGYEGAVLDGAGEVLPQLRAVLVEMSTAELYSGQDDWTEIHSRLLGSGFSLWNLMPDFKDRRTGRLLQFDGLYLRTSDAVRA